MMMKDALEKSYKTLEPFSDKYKVDFKRFLFSLNLLSGQVSLEDKKILDIGSGIGIMISALKNLGAETVGVDKVVACQGDGVRVVESDIVANALPFNDKTFDIVTCDAVIEHLPESPKRLFGEICRVLKNDGLFLVTTPNLANLLRRIRFVLGKSPHWGLEDFFEKSSNFDGHWREYNINELAKMLEWASFGVLEKKTKNIFLSPKKFLKFSKIPEQLCGLLSLPFPKSREMIYILARKS